MKTLKKILILAGILAVGAGMALFVLKFTDAPKPDQRYTVCSVNRTCIQGNTVTIQGSCALIDGKSAMCGDFTVVYHAPAVSQ